MGLVESSSVSDDGVVLANRAPPREKIQWDHPGSMLSFPSGSEIKRITAGVKAPPRPSLPSFDLLDGPSPSGKVNFERKQEFEDISVLRAIGAGADVAPAGLIAAHRVTLCA